MKKAVIILFLQLTSYAFLYGQQTNSMSDNQTKAITALIANYSLARENKDTILLKTILTRDVDQLVSTGEWRTGLKTAVEGMIKSSASSPGTRTLQVDKIQMISASAAIVDCRYQIQDNNGVVQKLWSTFIVVSENELWKIKAIRNMMPTQVKN